MNDVQKAVVQHMVEALEQATPHLPVHTDWHFEAIAAGKALLEQQEPVQPVANIPGLAADESAFIRWALKNKYDTSSHPMFFVMLDPKTYEARMGWKAAVAHYELASPPAQPAPVQGPYSAPIKELWPVAPKPWVGLTDAQLEIASLREKLNYERRVNGILADKLAAAEYDRNHYKSLLKKALEK